MGHSLETAQLPSRSSIEWSSRLTRSLGRCYPHKRKVRLAARLQSAELGLLEEVLCHETAHLAAHELHGQGIRPHGAEWKAPPSPAASAGQASCAPLAMNRERASPYRTASPRQHHPRKSDTTGTTSVSCVPTRVARRSMRRWRCRACVDAGLDGILTITRRKR